MGGWFGEERKPTNGTLDPYFGFLPKTKLLHRSSTRTGTRTGRKPVQPRFLVRLILLSYATAFINAKQDAPASSQAIAGAAVGPFETLIRSPPRDAHEIKTMGGEGL